MPLLRRPLTALLLLAGLLLAGTAQAALITRTITLDGNFSDWDGSGGTYLPAGNILTNSGQFSTDCASGTACERDGTLGSTGRDLKGFAFTWDSNYLYFYLERWDNSNNVTDWWFYMDTNGDQRMNTGEKVMHVKWSGSNRNTTAGIASYNAVNAGGDSLVGTSGFADGYRMPGSVGAETNMYAGTYGGSSGLQMEARIAWSTLGLSGPTNMGFHMSSSNGSNLPGNIIDNMDGPSGNQLFPGDLQMEKFATTTNGLVTASGNFTYTVTLRNLGFNTATSLVVSDVLPADIVYLGSSPSAGTFVDSNSDGIPDRWNIASMAGQSSETLTITARGANVTANVNRTNTASLVSYTGLNQDTGNDSASATVTVAPTPQLTTVKTTTGNITQASPGNVIRYRVNVSNSGYGLATSVVAIDTLSPFTALRLDTFGPGQAVRLTPGATPPGVTLGTVQYYTATDATGSYVPVSGGDGAPAGYDGAITQVRMPVTGNMAAGASFLLEYDVIVR